MSLFPNSSKGEVTIDLQDLQSDVTLSVYDITGKRITQDDYKNTSSINLELPESTGLYFIHLKRATNETTTLKVLKE